MPVTRLSSRLIRTLIVMAWLLASAHAPIPAQRAVAIPATAAAAASTTATAHTLAVVGQLGGTSHAVAAQGDRVIVGIGPRLVVLDAADPAALRVLGRSEILDGLPVDMVVHQDIAYVGAGDFLYVIDVADAGRPTVVGSHRVNRHTALALRAEHVFVTATAHLLIVDVSDPTLPRRVDSIRFGPPVQLHDIAIDGELAFVAAGEHGLHIMNVANVRSPRSLVTLDSPANARAVTAEGGFVYVVDSYVAHGEGGSLGVIDVREPETPVELARIHHPGLTTDVFLAQDRLYLAGQGAGVFVFDVSTPSLPKKLAQSKTPGYVERLVVAGGHVFVADALDGLHVFALSSMTSPRLLPARPITRRVNQISVADRWAFVAEGAIFGGGVRMLDVADPSAPREVAHLDTTGDPVAMPGRITSVEARGDLVFAVGFIDDGLYVLRNLGGEALEPIGFLALDPARDLAVSGDYVFVAHFAGVAVIDVSLPERPRLAATIQADGPVYVEVVDDIAYVAAYLDDVALFDVSEPEAPEAIGMIDVSALAYAIEDGVAVILDGRWLRTYDVSDPSTPKLLATLQMDVLRPRVDLRDGVAYLALGRDGVAVVDVSDPARPELLAQLDLDCCSGIQVRGNHLYLAGGQHGLVVLEMRNGALPANPWHAIHLPIAFASGHVAGMAGPE